MPRATWDRRGDRPIATSTESGRRPLDDRIEALLPLVEKPARYLGTEINAVRKAWPVEAQKSLRSTTEDAPRITWLLILPDVYEIGMSHQGLRILYDILNHRDDTLAERAFAPWTDMDDLMRQEGIPLFSLESRRPARDFDVISFSLQYELLATNVLNLLDLAGIPLLSRDRAEGDPLIAAGGPCTGNPEPLADFIDFFLIGDGEDAVGRISEVMTETKAMPRKERLLALAHIPGIYVPRFYEPIYRDGRQVGVEPSGDVPFPIRRTYLEDLEAAPYPVKPVVPLITAVQDRLTLEIQRGCTQGCRFCQAGIFYRPVRERSPQRLVNLVAAGLASSGWDEVSLSSLSSADYSQIRPLARILTAALEPTRTALSFSSLRVDSFSVELAELVARVRKTGFTFAPEAGSQRLRDVINKRVADEDLLRAVEAAYAKGWQRVKLYFMIGLPTETDEDIEGIVSLARQIREIGRRYGGAKKATISIGSFVPKAHTPFQWEAFADRRALIDKLHRLKDKIQSRWSVIRWHDVDVSFIEAVLSRGDRRLGDVILKVWSNGARFDGWSDFFSIDRWEEAFRQTGINPTQYTRAIHPDEPLPWDHIHLGVERAWLWREHERALAGHTTPDCRPARLAAREPVPRAKNSRDERTVSLCTSCGLDCAGRGLDRSDMSTFAPALGAEACAKLQRELSSSLALGPAQLPTAQQEPASLHRYRITFAKLGRLRLISHLETGRLLIRLFRMAHWPLAFSSGYHPHPKLSYGPPLPVGIEGEREILDVQLCRPLQQDLIDQINRHAPEGLRILRYQHLADKPVSPAAAAHSASYRVRVPRDLCDLALQEKRLETFEQTGSVIALKATKGRQKTVDLKRCVQVLQWHPDGPVEGDVADQKGDVADQKGDVAGQKGDVAGEKGDVAGQKGDVADQSGTLIMELLLQEPSGHVIGPLPLLREVFKWSPREMSRCRVTRVRLLDHHHRPLASDGVN
ncbi:MAG: TIGR03960 family B12-binding radical SAM protein [Candidatus Eisenbacteria sp.]|nr:TIGR03960 family B12-binding radical SAM protein [Candidatus Eisenbacteria bacterium]